MNTWLLTFLFLIPVSQSKLNISISFNPECNSLSDCPKGFSKCVSIAKLQNGRCIKNMSEICTGGMPSDIIIPCSRPSDCGSDQRFEWCDFKTKFCCQTDSKSPDSPMCPDRLTPLYGQEKCTNVEKEMVYSGKSDQKGGLCYKGYSCPPKITRPTDSKFGGRIFRTNLDCSTEQEVEPSYDFMFCHNKTGKLWMMGQYNVNGDEVFKHWTHCQLNKDCGEGQVCVKEDLRRYRCYDDPTIEVNYDWIVARLIVMFLIPILFLAGLISLIVKYMD